MKVMLINGSPNKNGATYTALKKVEEVLQDAGILSEIVHVPTNVTGCRGCMQCRKTGKCFITDEVNLVSDKMRNTDGLIIGTPVYYGGMPGSLVSYLDRLFVSTPKSFLKLKPASAITVSRRLGNTTTFDAVNKYFMVADMMIISSNDWNEVHGLNGEEVLQDLEGLQTIQRMAQNMIYYLALRDFAKNQIPEPIYEKKIRTSFIR